ncbi:MAG: S41 family peptidase [Terracidiphilus sp.]|nr:S41 family peptidase [Terracidiphilus sp.]
MPATKALRRLVHVIAFTLTTAASASSLFAADAPALHRGYYTDPALHGDAIVFTSEGDLWTVGIHGGQAHRLTSGAGTEQKAVVSPDGKTVAFRADYEGPSEVYTIPIEGGLPQRRTWDGDSLPAGWAPDGRLMIATGRYATLPGAQLVLVDNQGGREVVPLAQAAQGAYSDDGHTLFFTRWFRQFSETKRYKGGWAENIWSFDGTHEAAPLTADFAGASTNPMFWKGRVYFLSDRDGVMNVYSMDPLGHDVKQQSHQHIFDVQSASLDSGRIAYASGSDLWLLDLTTGQEEVIPVTLVSDFDQMREHWVKKPTDYLTAVHLAPDGSSAVFTARGELFTLPAKTGRVVKVAGDSSVRYREARFLPDGKSVVALSTASGETEFWKFAANGEGAPEQWTSDAKVLRWEGIPSPDGHWLAHRDKDQQLWIYDIKAKTGKRIAQSMNGDYSDLSWSGDSRWLAYVQSADNMFAQIELLNIETGVTQTITSDRYNSINPVWSSDGKWLYFLSDRNLKSTIGGPWGPRQPEPHFDRSVKIYELALTSGLRSPFLPPDELHPDTPEKKDDEKKADNKDKDKDKDTKAAPGDKKPADADKAPADKKDDKKDEGKKEEDKDKKKPAEVKIDFTDLAARLDEVPAPAGNYNSLQAAEKRLCWLNASDDEGEHLALQCLDIANKGDEVDTVLAEVKGYEISLDRKKVLVNKGDSFYILDADVKGAGLTDPKALPKAAIDLSHWNLSTNPREEFRGIFLDAWRLERDYFYDKKMHGVDWTAMRDRYLPLVDRVADRDELNNVIAQMVSELSALHTFVFGGDARKPADKIDIATLGAVLRRDQKAGGYVIQHIYAHDPDLPDQASPLARPESLAKEGEVIVSIDGQNLLSAADERSLLRGKAGQQVLLRIKPATGEARDVLVKPISEQDDARMRYAEWEYTRRTEVDAGSNGQIGYVHLRAMGSNDINQWAREYYPVFDRQGLIVDMRHNHGGNIDSWLLADLLRKAWFYWQPRIGNPQWNMQYAFRGHIVVLCDQETASDGEAFSEGFKRMQMGKVIGTRTWGGEIWLSGSNVQADNGVATAAETGVYGPDGIWLIEGHGVEPDIVVDNLPHATFAGSDAQLQAAMDLLKREIKDDPRPVPPHPPYPDKSFQYQP